MRTDATKIARLAILTALTLVLGYFDRAIPLSAVLGGAVPGIKLGLANTVLLYGVYMLRPGACVLLMLAKVLLSGFLFGSPSAILYSLSGGVLSLAVMMAVSALTGHRRGFAVIITSLAGAVFHNVGQILAAAAVLHTPRLLVTYLPVLVGVGAVVGCLTGMIARLVFRAIQKTPAAAGDKH